MVSPDGHTVALVSDGPDPTRSDVVLQFFDTKTGKLTRAPVGENPPLGHQDVAWRPDGKHAPVRHATTATGPGARRRSGSTTRRHKRTSALTGPGYTSPTFSPDGKWIAATRTTTLGTDVVILNAKTGTEVLRVTNDGQLLGARLVAGRRLDRVPDHHLPDRRPPPDAAERPGTAPGPWATRSSLTQYSGLDGSSRPGWFVPAGSAARRRARSSVGRLAGSVAEPRPRRRRDGRAPSTPRGERAATHPVARAPRGALGRGRQRRSASASTRIRRHCRRASAGPARRRGDSRRLVLDAALPVRGSRQAESRVLRGLRVGGHRRARTAARARFPTTCRVLDRRQAGRHRQHGRTPGRRDRGWAGGRRRDAEPVPRPRRHRAVPRRDGVFVYVVCRTSNPAAAEVQGMLAAADDGPGLARGTRCTRASPGWPRAGRRPERLGLRRRRHRAARAGRPSSARPGSRLPRAGDRGAGRRPRGDPPRRARPRQATARGDPAAASSSTFRGASPAQPGIADIDLTGERPASRIARAAADWAREGPCAIVASGRRGRSAR